jgi:uncharacterized protein (TIGR03435 family)
MTIPLTEEDYRALQIRSGANAGIAMPPFLMKMIESASLDSLHQGLAKFGLKLESKKAQLEVLVIDAATTPTEN